MRPKIKKPFAFFHIFLLAAFAFGCGQPKSHLSAHPPALHHLVVLHTNDTHGHPVKFFHYPAPDVGGLPARMSLVRDIRSTSKNVLLLDAGDINTGKAESNVFKAEPDILGYNAIGYDAVAIGNHEFDHDLKTLRTQMALARFPFLSANITTRDGQPIARSHMIKEFDGFKVAIFGLTTKETEVVGNPEHVKDLDFEDETGIAKKLVHELRKQADVVIALVHLGIYEDPTRGSRRLAAEVSGINLIVDGHSHTRLDSPICVTNRETGQHTWIVQAWQWGLVLGRVDLQLQEGKVVDFRFRSIPINLKVMELGQDQEKRYRFIDTEIREDEGLAERLRPYVLSAEAALSEVVGRAQGPFLSKDARSKETALGNVIADSMLWATERMGADFAVINGGAIRADLREGPISRKLISEILPFENSIMVLTLKGSDIQALFDFLAAIPPGRGAFPQVSNGLTFTINRSTGKCESLLIRGQPVDPLRIYKVATNSYLAQGGDGYTIFLNALDRYESSMLQSDVFAAYVKSRQGQLKPELHGRITFRSPDESLLPLQLRRWLGG